MSNVIFGNPNHIEEGTIFSSRIDLFDAGLHRSTVRGIDGNGIEGAAAIVFLEVMKMIMILELKFCILVKAVMTHQLENK